MSSSDANPVHIYVATHLPIGIPESEIVSAVQAGSNDSTRSLFRLTDSDTIDNIAHLNSMYCELTVQYLLLASDSSVLPEKIGFMHYRRFICFTNPLVTIGIRLLGRLPKSQRWYVRLSNLCLEPRKIKMLVAGVDLVTPKPVDVRSLGFRSVRDHFVKSHFESDWEVCGKVIKELYPDLAEEFVNLDSNYLIYTCNIYIMSKRLFLDYFSMLYAILERVRVSIDFENRNAQETRALGYLAERIFTAFVSLKRKEGTTTIKELPLARVDPPRTPTLNKAE